MKYNAVKLQTATPTAKASDIPVDDKKFVYQSPNGKPWNNENTAPPNNAGITFINAPLIALKIKLFSIFCAKGITLFWIKSFIIFPPPNFITTFYLEV